MSTLCSNQNTLYPFLETMAQQRQQQYNERLQQELQQLNAANRSRETAVQEQSVSKYPPSIFNCFLLSYFTNLSATMGYLILASKIFGVEAIKNRRCILNNDPSFFYRNYFLAGVSILTSAYFGFNLNRQLEFEKNQIKKGAEKANWYKDECVPGYRSLSLQILFGATVGYILPYFY
jgi:hypothetical protein